MLLDDFRSGIIAVLHPSGITSKMTVQNAILTYYKFSAIPMVLALIVALLISSYLATIVSLSPTSQLIGGSAALTIAFYRKVLFLLVTLPILMPIFLLVLAGIMHAIGGSLKIFKEGFSRTFTAVVFANFATLLFWFTFVSLIDIGGIIYFVAFIYSIYVLVVALSKQHEITKLNAFFVGVLSFFVVLIILSLLSAGFTYAIASAGTA